MDSVDARRHSPGRRASASSVEVPHDDFERDLHVVFEHRLVGAVAHTSRAPDEEHRHRRDGGHHARIMARAAAEAVKRLSGRHDRLAEQVAQTRISRDGPMMLFLDDCERDGPARAPIARHVAESRPRPPIVASSFAWRTSMQSRAVPGTTLTAPGSTRAFRRWLEAPAFLSEPLDLEHELGRRRKCIAPALHRQACPHARLGLAIPPRACSAPRLP